MKVVTSATELANFLQPLWQNHTSIGFVPTLGALHAGHASLIHTAKAASTVTVSSIFVNPTQFRQDKFKAYPRDFQQDLGLLTELGVDYVYMPEVEDIYCLPASSPCLWSWQDNSVQRDEQQFIQDAMLNGVFIRIPQRFTTKLEGSLYPWHFDAVATVVYRLLQDVRPSIAYFGAKDPLQVSILESMVQQFQLPTRTERVPTLRESDGLPFSSRNALLSDAGHSAAVHAYKALISGISAVQSGDKDAQSIHRHITELMNGSPDITLEQLAIVDRFSLENASEINRDTLFYTAFFVEGIRLTDNLVVGEV